MLPRVTLSDRVALAWSSYTCVHTSSEDLGVDLRTWPLQVWDPRLPEWGWEGVRKDLRQGWHLMQLEKGNWMNNQSKEGIM